MTTLTQTKSEQEDEAVETMDGKGATGVDPYIYTLKGKRVTASTPGALRLYPTTFTKNGFTYEQVLRDGDVAIYRQTLRSGAGNPAYEVIRIRVEEASVVFGNVVPRREIGPSNEDWGVWGWTYPDLPLAKGKMRELVDEVGEGRRRKGGRGVS